MQVRALTTLFHQGRLIQPGEVFDYPDDQAKFLKGVSAEGIELVNKKSTAAFAKVQADALQALEDTARALDAHFGAVRAELEADPTRGDLVQKVLDAETAALEARKNASAAADAAELV